MKERIFKPIKRSFIMISIHKDTLSELKIFMLQNNITKYDNAVKTLLYFEAVNNG